MKIIKTDSDQVVQAAINLMESGSPGCVLCIPSSVWVACGNESKSDAQVATGDCVPVLDCGYYGGTCVVLPGDLSVMIVHTGYSTVGVRMLEATRDLLAEREAYSVICGNDLMLRKDGTMYKVGSYASTWMGEMLVTVLHISINTDAELIRMYCNSKQMLKQPGQIGNLGITAEDLWDVFTSKIIENDGER